MRDCRIKQIQEKSYILDCIRKKYLLLTPEEWVRQHILHYLIEELCYPKGLFRSEKKLTGIIPYYRPDILFCDKWNKTKMMIECKAPSVKLIDTALHQIIQYHRQCNVNILLLTNGIMHFCWALDKRTGSFNVMQHIPSYQEFLMVKADTE